MNRPFLRCVGIALVSTLWQIPPSSGQEDQLALRNIFEKARKIANIKAQGRPGFRLIGEAKIWVKKDTASQGKYLFISTPEGKWKEEIEFYGYKRVRSGDGKQFWQVRSPETENQYIIEVDHLLEVGRMLKIEDKAKLRRVAPANIEGTDADCIQHVSATGYTKTFCFNPNSGELLRYTPQISSSDLPWRAAWEDYSQFQQWGDGRFPRTLHGFNGKQMVVEVRLEEINPLPPLPQDFFDPPKEATLWGDCTAGEMWKLKDSVPPEYPQSARMRGIAGTVTFSAVVEDNGHVSNLHVTHSAGTELDQAAANAVSRWRYERTISCSGSNGRSETTIDVIFSLRW